MAEEPLQKVQQPTQTDVQKSINGISNLFATVNQTPPQNTGSSNTSITGTSSTSGGVTSSQSEGQ